MTMTSVIIPSQVEIGVTEELIPHEEGAEASNTVDEVQANREPNFGHFHELRRETREAFEKLKEAVKDSHKAIGDARTELKLKEERCKGVSREISSINFDDTIKLNVGGTIYQTSVETLRKYPGSLIAEMFSGKFSVKQGSDGCFFIDRDGAHFRYILNYLRTGEALMSSVLKETSDEILVEAEYFGLVELVNILKIKLKGNDVNDVIVKEDDGGSETDGAKSEARNSEDDVGVLLTSEPQEDFEKFTFTEDMKKEDEELKGKPVENIADPSSIIEERVNAFLSVMSSNMALLEGATNHFAEMSKKLSHVHFSEIVKINVGGRIFQTTLKTLQKEPASLLASMFSKCFDLKQEGDGSYFIDRDGTHFHHILNYLRLGELENDDIEEYGAKIQKEAKFYGLKGLEKQILDYNTVKLDVGGKEFEVSRDVLRKYPKSIFGRMLAGEEGPYVKGKDGFYIERDGTSFHHILNYLNMGTISEEMVCKSGSLLKREADFYMLKGLKEVICKTEIVNVNVGGRKFTTTRKTLMRYPRSKLAKMLSGEEFCKMPDGSFFIDRNGETFGYLLEKLQADTVPSSSDCEYEELKDELSFYSLDKPVITERKLVKSRRKKCAVDIPELVEVGVFSSRPSPMKL